MQLSCLCNSVKQDQQRIQNNWHKVFHRFLGGVARQKEKRIEALEPIFKNGQFWCHRPHEPFINEYKAYPAPATIDCLDTLGYAPRIFEVMRRKEMYQWMRTQQTAFQERKVGAAGY
jgi:hypothetical protein